MRAVPSPRLERAALAALVLHALACLVVIAVAGDWLDAHPARRELGLAIFARSQIVGSFAVLAFALQRRHGSKWIASLVAVFATGWIVEAIGLATGYPFGGYVFTDLLGPKLPGGVPVLLALSWFDVSVPAWAVASVLVPSSSWRRVLVSVFLMLSWDALCDPIMGHLYPFWIWAEHGPYYGIPWSNFGGWLLTSTIVAATLEALAPRDSSRALVALAAAGFLGPLGLVLVSRFWLAALVGVPALACIALALPCSESARGDDTVS